eukprot:GHVS01042283.1.p1 GENE.GHVS01042283.1~~GHVS01042283.1.p1  ORF type:complete len:658 (-),score=70.28 GHVS01042283.1:144-2117(-)
MSRHLISTQLPSTAPSRQNTPAPVPASSAVPIMLAEAHKEYELSVDDEPDSELPLIARQMSKGLTGETFYDYDLPLSRDDPITILHFNDIYNIQPFVSGSSSSTNASDSQGGVSRFITALREHSGEHPLTLFSGDAFNPSLMSTHTRGRHMVPFLNMLRIHTAVFGNHDFDFGIDQLEYLSGSTRFPWLLSNVYDADTHAPLANAISYRLFEWQGIRVGIIGLVEYEWLSTLASIDADDVIYKNFVTEANRLCTDLRAKEAEIIIALTHMRAPNDEILAREAEDLDLILGGHDHDYYGVRRIGKTVVVKSGSDFREFTKLVIYPGRQTGDFTEVPYDEDNPPVGVLSVDNSDGGCVLMPRFRGGSAVEWECVHVTADKYPPNKHVDILVGRYHNELLAQMDKVIGELAVPLETRFSVIRHQETNSGNWLCDLMRKECRAQVAVLNSGTVRADCLFPPGLLRMRDLTAMLPMLDPLVVVEVTGAQLLQVLENGVCMYPKLEGRFLQVSGVSFSFDPTCQQGQRLVKESVKVAMCHDSNVLQPVQLQQKYQMATKEYLAFGKDGFDVLVNCPLIRDSEETPNLPTMVRNALSLAAMANGFKKPHNRQSTRRLETLKTLSAGGLQTDHSLLVVKKEGKQYYMLTPKVDGRIKVIDNSKKM